MEPSPDSPKTLSGRPLGKLELFTGFAEMGLCGFGGVATIARHVIVDKRRWMSEHDYATLLGMGQILPGGNIINMTVMLGDRFQGPLGSIVALSGLMIMPLFILLGLTIVYDAYASNPDVRAATIGAGAAAAGLVIGMGLKMGRALRLPWVHLAFAVVTFIAMGVLRLPFIATIIVLAPLCIAATFWMRSK
jgi:chromate transporter